MTKFLIVCFLVGWMDKPSQEEFPPEEVMATARGLSSDQFEMFLRAAAAKNVYFPDQETSLWWDMGQPSHLGAYNVLWRRAQGRPFLYPIDHLLGQRIP